MWQRQFFFRPRNTRPTKKKKKEYGNETSIGIHSIVSVKNSQLVSLYTCLTIKRLDSYIYSLSVPSWKRYGKMHFDGFLLSQLLQRIPARDRE